MSALAEDVTAEVPPGPTSGGDDRGGAGKDAGAAPAGWQKDGRGRMYVKPPGGGNVVFRRDEETVEQALERASRPDADKPPKPRKKKLPKSETNEADLKTVEAALAQVFMAPGQVAGALLRDQWLLLHFQARGPELARALTNAAEHNPWLRKKLLELASGGAAAMQLQAIVLLALAAAGYAVPPLAYLLGWDISPVIQMAVLGGPIPGRPRPSPAQQPAPDANVTPDLNGYEGYAQGSAEAT